MAFNIFICLVPNDMSSTRFSRILGEFLAVIAGIILSVDLLFDRSFWFCTVDAVLELRFPTSLLFEIGWKLSDGLVRVTSVIRAELLNLCWCENIIAYHRV
jgi:hypothetical protein